MGEGDKDEDETEVLLPKLEDGGGDLAIRDFIVSKIFGSNSKKPQRCLLLFEASAFLNATAITSSQAIITLQLRTGQPPLELYHQTSATFTNIPPLFTWQHSLFLLK